jgi:hypothetical protein
MPIGYTYDIWDGKNVIGSVTESFPLRGKFYVFSVLHPFKELYVGKQSEHICIPIHYIQYDNGVTITSTRVLDVRRKSKRQKALICGKAKKV